MASPNAGCTYLGNTGLPRMVGFVPELGASSSKCTGWPFVGVGADSKIAECNCPVWLCKECVVYVQIQAWLNERGPPRTLGSL